MQADRWSEDAGEILGHVVDCHRQGLACGLVVVTDTIGGALRAPGALAAIDSHGAMVGYVSNGCVDGDIIAQLLDAMRAMAPRVVRYGVGSPWQDLRLPCGGGVELALIPTPRTDRVAQLYDALSARQEAVLNLDMLCGPVPVMHRAFALRPRPALRLAGRGAALGAMARAGAAAGFEISVASPDPLDLDALADLSLRAMHHLAVPGDMPDAADDPDTAVVLLFHDHDWEPALLKQALDGPAGFIGAMGSRRTQAARLLALRADGVEESQLVRIIGPLGLVESLREANLIALSALAQIVEHLRKAPPARSLIRAA